MKMFYKNILSIVLAFLVVFSSSSFVVSQHYCGSRLVDVTVFGNPEKCFSAAVTSENITCIQAKNCCNDVLISVPSNDLVSISFDVDIDSLIFDVNSILISAHIETYADSKSVTFNHYKPPKLIQDIPVFYEVYLI